MNKKLLVTSPLLPDLKEFVPYLEDIWSRKWLTNNGHYHQELEKALCEYLGVPFISLFTNGTLPIMVAIQALSITGEVITTPYSFVATTHSLSWNNVKPVFVDIDPRTCNIDPKKIEKAITPRTSAIMPVHVYGTPCETEQIQKIADKYGLKVIYDAAHTFGVKIDGQSILNAGDMSTLSFHATKVFNTVEGGALICHSQEIKNLVDSLKNFGYAGETDVTSIGMNCKMDEIRSAFGLATLKHVDQAIAIRKKIAERYREGLRDIHGISYMNNISDNIKYNYAYFPIFIDADKYGMTRDELYSKMKENNIISRRYFYPLISSFPMYNQLESSRIDNLPNANRITNSVMCLPIHHELSDRDIDRILELILLSQQTTKIETSSILSTNN